MAFSKKLYQLRNAHSLSQKKLADYLNVSQASINYWEKGQRTPSIEQLQKIADFFNVTPDSLLNENQPVTMQDPLSMMFGSFYNEEDGVADIHFTTDEFTLQELNEIKNFADFIKSKRNDNFK